LTATNWGQLVKSFIISYAKWILAIVFTVLFVGHASSNSINLKDQDFEKIFGKYSFSSPLPIGVYEQIPHAVYYRISELHKTSCSFKRNAERDNFPIFAVGEYIGSILKNDSISLAVNTLNNNEVLYIKYSMKGFDSPGCGSSFPQAVSYFEGKGYSSICIEHRTSQILENQTSYAKIHCGWTTLDIEVLKKPN